MPEVTDSKYMVNAGWDDVPHLTEAAKRELLSSTPPYLREARSKGIPSLGSGAIYPIPLEEVTVHPFEIPAWWKRGYGMDVGWNRTAALWLAQNPEDQVLYAYAEHYMGQAVPTVHAEAIKARRAWIKGAIDPASRNRGQDEGKQLLATYRALGLLLVPAINAVEPGLYDVWQALSIGRLKFFSTLQHLPAEYRLYRRDENGKVVKKNDHLMDCLRYAKMTWGGIAQTEPVARTGGGVTAADKTAGY